MANIELFVNNVAPVVLVGVKQGPAGPSGSAGGSIYEHTQTSATTTWSILHNLARYPASVTTVDNSGLEIKGAVNYFSINEVRVDFGSAQSGKAYIS